MTLKLELTRTFNASQQQVFEAFTKPAILKQWFAPGNMTVPRAELDPKVGGAYTIDMQDPSGQVYTVSGTIKAYAPHSKLAYTWKWADPDAVETLVTFTFAAKGDDATEVTLLHENFRNEESMKLHQEGWEGCFANFSKL